MRRNIKLTGEPNDDLSSQDYAMIIWLQAKRIARERREREAKEKAKRERRQLEGRS